eukprot:1159727-Pelagomonas_calceolata.AAC.2
MDAYPEAQTHFPTFQMHALACSSLLSRLFNRAVKFLSARRQPTGPMDITREDPIKYLPGIMATSFVETVQSLVTASKEVLA